MPQDFVEENETIELLGWPTDVVSVNPKTASLIHTLIVWIPGNPGQHDWYGPDFVNLLSKLGSGYAIRSLSHAGHGLNSTGKVVEHYAQHRKSPLIPWTVEGQVLHKLTFLDRCLSETKARLVLIGHSFGCHVLQKVCVLRPDILERTIGLLFLMPYIRTKPAFVSEQMKLDFGGSHPEHLISAGTRLSRFFKTCPESLVHSAILKGLHERKPSEIATHLLCDPFYPRNFFELGTEELRDIPNEIDLPSLRCKGSCPLFVLCADHHDQWFPFFHAKELQEFSGIETTQMVGTSHDYVCQAKRTDVVSWCASRIARLSDPTTIRSRL